MTDPVLLDLGPSDVHAPGAVGESDNKGKRKRKARDNRRRPPRSIHVRADLAPGGALHVRHLRDFYDGEGVSLSEDLAGEDNKPVWIQVAKQGSFAGHAAGPFELTLKTFDEIIANFKATKNRTIPIDYEHASEADETSGSIPTTGAPAQGWIVDLKIEGGNLWGLVEWGDQARAQIRAKQYRYFSPAIRFNSKDRQSGKPIGARMTSGALTNNPFLDGLQPLAAKDAATTLANAVPVVMGGKGLAALVHGTHEYMPKLKAALRAHELAPAEQLSDHLDNLRAACMSAGGAGSYQGVDLGAYCRDLRDLVGAPVGMTLEQLFDCVQDLIDAAIEEHEERMHTATDAGARTTAASTPDAAPATPAAAPAAALADKGEQKNDTTPAASAAAPSGPAAETNMDKQKEADLTTEIATLKDKVSVAETAAGKSKDEQKLLADKVSTLETEAAKTSLQLKDATARAEAAEGVKAGLEKVIVVKAKADGSPETLVEAATRILAENADLRKAKADRDEADLKADVELAYLTYKDAKKLEEKDLSAMTVLARADRAEFHKMYPPVSPEQRYLQRKLVDNERRDPPQPSGEGFQARVRFHQSQGHNLIEAQNLASAELRS